MGIQVRGSIASVDYVGGAIISPAAYATDPYWATDDNRYIGPTVLQLPYVELVGRAWHSSYTNLAREPF